MAPLNHKLSFGTDQKIRSLEELKVVINNLRLSQPDDKIVLTTGVFDLIHPGHIDYLNKARSFGEILVVSIVDDKFVHKKPGQPIFSQTLRLQWLAALEVVDFVVLNGDFGPWKVMKAIKPNIYAKGQGEKINWTDGLKGDFQTAYEVGCMIKIIKEVMHSTEIFENIRKL